MTTKQELQAKEPMALPKEPAKPAGQKTEPKVDDTKQKAEQLLTALKGLNVESPQDLQGMHRASQEVGQMANLLGDARKEIQALKGEIMKLQSFQNLAPQPGEVYRSPYEPEVSQQTGPVSEAMLEKVIRKVVDTTIISPQREAHQAWLNEMNAIHGDPHFKNMEGLRQAWQEIYNMPETQAKFQTGQARPTEIFQDVKMKFMTGMLRNASQVIERLTGQTITPAGDVKAQHIEEGTGQTTPKMPTSEERDTSLRQINEARQAGRISSDQALQSIVNQFLPKDDPIWRT